MGIGPSNRTPYRAQLDMGPGTKESLVELNSTLDLVQRKALSSSTRHWTWYNGKPCWAQLDVGTGTTESLVELNSTVDLVQQKALSNSTRQWTWYSRKPCRNYLALDLVQRRAMSNSTRHWTVTVLLALFTQSFPHETYFTGLKWLSVVKLTKKKC